MKRAGRHIRMIARVCQAAVETSCCSTRVGAVAIFKLLRQRPATDHAGNSSGSAKWRSGSGTRQLLRRLEKSTEVTRLQWGDGEISTLLLETGHPDGIGGISAVGSWLATKGDKQEKC